MRKAVGIIILVFVLSMAVVHTLSAAPPPPGQPPDPPDPGGGGVPIGGSPIEGGALILVALAAGYGARMYYIAKKRKISE